jgi:tetratricopeptide (TPR) repeat protein
VVLDARRQARAKRYDKALQLMATLPPGWPSRGPAWAAVARLLESAPAPVAIAACSRWVEAAEDDAEAHSRLAALLARDPRTRGQAKEHLDAAARLAPGADWARIGLAIWCAEGRRFADALHHVEEAQRCAPANVDLLGMKAEYLEELGRADEALRALDELLAARPGDAAVSARRDRLRVRAGR